MTFFHELLVLHKGGAKFKALVTGSLGSLETCFLEHTMTKVLFFFPKAARGISMIKLYPLKNLHGWGCEGCAYLLDKTKYPSHLVGKGARCTSQQRYKGHAEQQLIRKQTLPLYLGSEVLQLWLHSVFFFPPHQPAQVEQEAGAAPTWSQGLDCSVPRLGAPNQTSAPTGVIADPRPSCCHSLACCKREAWNPTYSSRPSQPQARHALKEVQAKSVTEL